MTAAPGNLRMNPIMPYLIDGHNLIPKLPGLSLAALDDEQHLLVVLQEYCRLRRRQVDVYFDNAPPGQPRTRRYGAVTAHFTPRGSTADDAIRARLARLGRSGKNWIVVTSDRSVLASARESHAQVLSSEVFARELMAVLAAGAPETEKPPDKLLDAAEVDAWLDVFRSRKGGR